MCDVVGSLNLENQIVMTSIAKILVVEDELRVAELIMAGLEENGYEVTHAPDGAAGLRLFFQHQFDLILSDIKLPKMDGLELCKEIRQANKEVPIMMLTALGSTDDKLDGFDAGADDYLTKPFDFRELLARIAVLLKRKTQSLHELEELTYADIRVNVAAKKVTRGEVAIKLSPKEYDLLLYMLKNPERVISRTEIMHSVWNTDFDPGTNFIDVCLNYLRKKIDKNFDTKLLHTKTGSGFILTLHP